MITLVGQIGACRGHRRKVTGMDRSGAVAVAAAPAPAADKADVAYYATASSAADCNNSSTLQVETFTSPLLGHVRSAAGPGVMNHQCCVR
jgi:hypothetical protein